MIARTKCKNRNKAMCLGLPRATNLEGLAPIAIYFPCPGAAPRVTDDADHDVAIHNDRDATPALSPLPRVYQSS